MRNRTEKNLLSQSSIVLAFFFLALFVGIGTWEDDLIRLYKNYPGLVWGIFSLPAVIFLAWRLIRLISDRNRETSEKNRGNWYSQKNTGKSKLKILEIIFQLIVNPVTKGFAFALLGIPVYYFLNFNAEGFITPNDYYQIIGIFADWFGLGYTIFIALVISNVWGKFDKIERNMEQESDNIFLLYEYTRMLSKSKLKNELLANIKFYINHLIENSAKEITDPKIRLAGDNLISQMRKKIGLIRFSGKNGVVVFSLIDQLNKLTETRSDRIGNSLQRIPRAVFVLVVIASVLLLMYFFSLNFDSPILGAGFIGGITFIVISVLLIITDLDNPYEGTWAINTEAWAELKNTIQTDKST